MRIFYGFESLPPFRRAVATVGSFDGVHDGHRTLLDAVKNEAAATGGESVVITFAPHPRIVLETASELKLLTSLDEKRLLLEQAGIDNLIVVPFTASFSRTSSEDFIRNDLVRKAHVATLIVGYNHRFGRDKEGDFAYLDHRHESLGISIRKVDRYAPFGEKISSTTIRALIERGELSHAVRLLGHPYPVLCRTDANDPALHTDDERKLLPPPGTYDVSVDGAADRLTIASDGTMRLEKTVPPTIRSKTLILIR